MGREFAVGPVENATTLLEASNIRWLPTNQRLERISPRRFPARQLRQCSDPRHRPTLPVPVMLRSREANPSFSATIFSTLKTAVELANATSASYAIASNGLRR